MPRPQPFKQPPLTLPTSCTPSQLLQHTIQCFTLYNTHKVNKSADICTDDYCRDNQITDSSVVEYITYIVNSYIAHADLYNSIINQLYHTVPLNKSYQQLCYIIITLYYTAIRNAIVTVEQLCRLVSTQSAYIVHPILNFLSHYSDATIYNQLCIWLDKTYIDTVLIVQLQQYDTEVDALIDKLDRNIKIQQIPPRRHTKPTEFRLSQSTATLYSQTQPIEHIPLIEPFHAQPVNPAIYKTNLQQITDEANARRLQRHEHRKTELIQNSTAPKFTTRQRKRYTEPLSVTQPLFKAKAVPRFESVDLPSPTKTQILRNELLYRTLHTQLSAQHLTEQRDNSIRMHMLDQAEDSAKQQVVNQRKHDNMLSRLNAVRAVKQQQRSNRQTAKLLQQQLQEQNSVLAELNAHELLIKQNNVKAINQQHDTALHDALLSIQQQKHDSATTIKQLTEQHNQLIVEQNETYLHEKQQLIADIQVQLSIADARIKRLKLQKTAETDPTTSGKLTLLNSMSIVELQERLKVLEQQNIAALEQKRNSIVAEKQLRQHVYDNMLHKHTELPHLVHHIRTSTKLVTKQHAKLDNKHRSNSDSECKTNECNELNDDALTQAIQQLAMNYEHTMPLSMTQTVSLNDTVTAPLAKTQKLSTVQQISTPAA